MQKIIIIGIGAGDPDYMTVQAINALNKVDVFFIPNKGAEKAALQRLRVEICERFIENRTYRFVEVEMPERAKEFSDYRSNVTDWHAQIEESYVKFLTNELGEGECGAILVWGDPALYDSTLRIVESIRSKGYALEYDVIPGISAIQVLTAKHRIPLNRIGGAVVLTPARRLAEGFPDDLDTIVVVLDGEQTFKRLDGEVFDIYWGAYLGTADEILLAGKLSEVRSEIETVRARARKEKGWIMDTYLLRRRQATG